MKRDLVLLAKELAKRPEGFQTNEFADQAGIARTSGSVYVAAYRNAGHIFTAKVRGELDRHFDTLERRDAWLAGKRGGGAKPAATDPVSIARGAIAFMAGKPFASSVQLAGHLHCDQKQIDAALAPLADAHRLVRVVALRDGASMFDYRLSATWKPQEKDFEICRGATIAPTAHVSPVAPAAPAPLRPEVITSTAKMGAEAGRRGAQSRTQAAAFDKSAGAAGANLGWAGSPAPTPVLNESGKLKDFIEDFERGTGAVVDLVDPVFAINSRGEMVIDTEGQSQFRFAVKDTVALYRFLVGASFLERISQGAAL